MSYPVLDPPRGWGKNLLPQLVSPDPDFAGSWEEREAIAERTGSLDFGCDIQGGLCKVRRGHDASWSKPERNCCHSCAYCNGYLLAIRPSAYNEVAGMFDGELGFWRAGVGCILPRKWRSWTCLTYNCHPQREMFTNELIQIGFPGRIQK